MFWLGMIVGLVVGATAGVVIICAISSNSVYDTNEALDLCRRELSFYVFQSGTAMAACNEATKCLKDQGWWSG